MILNGVEKFGFAKKTLIGAMSLDSDFLLDAWADPDNMIANEHERNIGDFSYPFANSIIGWQNFLSVHSVPQPACFLFKAN